MEELKVIELSIPDAVRSRQYKLIIQQRSAASVLAVHDYRRLLNTYNTLVYDVRFIIKGIPTNLSSVRRLLQSFLSTSRSAAMTYEY